MTQLQLLFDLDAYVIWFAFTASVLFPVLASLIWPWWKSAWGWNIITLEATIALALFPAWLRVAFGIHGFTYLFAWMQLGSVALVGVVVVWRLALIWAEQRRPLPHDNTQDVPVIDS